MATNESYPSFEINVGNREVSLQIGRCAVALFRHQQEVQYLAVDLGDEDESTLRVFNNPDFCEWLAGYKLVQDQDDKNVMHRAVVRRDFNGVNMTFRELTGWNPAIVEREYPNETEEEMWMEINSADMEDGLRELLG